MSQIDSKVYVVRANLLDRKKIRGVSPHGLQLAHTWAQKNIHGAYSIYSYPAKFQNENP